MWSDVSPLEMMGDVVFASDWLFNVLGVVFTSLATTFTSTTAIPFLCSAAGSFVRLLVMRTR